MEYISREAVNDLIEDMRNNHFILMCERINLSLLKSKVAEIPAADVQLVKHGRWIWVKDYRDCEGDIYSKYKCSCCDFGVGGIYSVEDLTHFCGNCGVRMDGDT